MFSGLKLYLSSPRNLAVEGLKLAAVIYNAWVSARWLGLSGDLTHWDPTVDYGAVIGALVVDGGFYACLVMMSMALYSQQSKAFNWWLAGSIIFSLFTFKNNLQFTAANWHPQTQTEISGWIGEFLNWLETSGTDFLFKSALTVFPLIPLSMLPPVKTETAEEIEDRAKVIEARGDVEVAKVAVKNRVKAMKAQGKQAGPFGRYLQQREAQKALMLAVKTELAKAGYHLPGFKDEDILVQAGKIGVYNPLTREVIPFTGKPPVTFDDILKIAIQNGLVGELEARRTRRDLAEDLEELAAWESQITRAVIAAGLHPDHQPAAPSPVEVSPEASETLETADEGLETEVEEEYPEAEEEHPDDNPEEDRPGETLTEQSMKLKTRYYVPDIRFYTGWPRSTIINRMKKNYSPRPGEEELKISSKIYKGKAYVDQVEMARLIAVAKRRRAQEAAAQQAAQSQAAHDYDQARQAAAVLSNGHSDEADQRAARALAAANAATE